MESDLQRAMRLYHEAVKPAFPDQLVTSVPRSVADNLARVLTELSEEMLELEKRAAKLEKIASVAAELDKAFWFDPTKGYACPVCDANLHPNAMGTHRQLNGDACLLEKLHRALADREGGE